MKTETQIKIGQMTTCILLVPVLFSLLLSIPNILEDERFNYEPLVLTILPFVLAILLGCYFLTVGRRILNLSLLLLVFISVIFLYCTYIVYFIDYTVSFLYVIFIILLSQSVFGMYREKRMALVTKDEQKQ